MQKISTDKKEGTKSCVVCGLVFSPPRKTSVACSAQCRKIRIVHKADQRYRDKRADIIRYNSERYWKNRDSIRAFQQKYRDSKGKSMKAYRMANLELARSKARAYYSKVRLDPEFRLRHRLRTRLSSALKSNARRGSAVRDLGCSIAEFKQHLESKFLPGMTWENWSRTGWHIDHIIPLTRFNLTDPSEIKRACHFSNLQTMWARDNISKSDK